MKKSVLLIAVVTISIIVIAATALSIDDFFLPGSQIGQSGNLETPDRCDNCHGGYDASVEPSFNWRGSMMAQAARDPLFYACLAVANKDAPGVGDLCLRCHTPDGWLNGRCEPTDGSALNNNDRQGVQCDFCHKLVTPLQKNELGEFINPYSDPLYDDLVYGVNSFTRDKEYLAQIIPIPGTTANGMYLADSDNAKRGPFSDAEGRHKMTYSPFHKEAALCGTCHDVSNPVFIRQDLSDEEYVFTEHLNAGDDNLAALNYDLRHMFPVERTYSEWLASGYSNTSNTYAQTCQDCHMADVTGKGANKKNAPTRTDLPLHDFTGGNTFVPLMVKSQSASEVDAAALDAGIIRARQMLRSAADFTLAIDEATNTATVTVTNKTGHKLPTGYPEGRRMWINLKVYYNDGSEQEWGGYNAEATPSLNEDSKIYECKPGFGGAWATHVGKTGPSFNFAINNKIWKDNRIPPRGFSHALLDEYQASVIENGVVNHEMFNSHSDVTSFNIGDGAYKVEAKLMYQTTSPEYVTFLRDNGGTAGQELYSLWEANGKSEPEVMNEAEEYIGTPPAEPELIVSDVSFLRQSAAKGKTFVSASVTVMDDQNNLMEGALVSATFSGPTSDVVTGTTGTNGQVVFDSRAVKNVRSEWCLTITDIDKSGYDYTLPSEWCESGQKSALIARQDVPEEKLSVYPNPFTDKLFFEFTREKAAMCTIDLYDLSGKKVERIFNEKINADQRYRIEYNPGSIAAGMLFYNIRFDGEMINGKVVQH